MCTAIAMPVKGRGLFFGRNMDIDFTFGERIAVTPREYSIPCSRGGLYKTKYAMIGMASAIDGYPLYADGFNEHGLAMAGLNFPEFAYYKKVPDETEKSISPYELIPHILGSCKNLIEAAKLLENTQICDIPFREDIPNTTLHWMIADNSGSIVVEAVREGLKIHDNPVNVLTNSPPFEYQLINLRRYSNLTVKPAESDFCGLAHKEIHEKGLGSVGLPGDYSSASRFVRAAYLLHNSKTDSCSTAAQMFHLLDCVAVVRGAIETESDNPYCTVYSACMDTEKGLYHYRTYDSLSVKATDIREYDINGKSIIELPLDRD